MPNIIMITILKTSKFRFFLPASETYHLRFLFIKEQSPGSAILGNPFLDFCHCE